MADVLELVALGAEALLDAFAEWDKRKMRELGAPEDDGLLGVGMIYPLPGAEDDTQAHPPRPGDPAATDRLE